MINVWLTTLCSMLPAVVDQAAQLDEDKKKGTSATQANSCHLCRSRTHDTSILARAKHCGCEKGPVLYCPTCLAKDKLNGLCKRCHYGDCCCLLPREFPHQHDAKCPKAAADAKHRCCYLRYNNRRAVAPAAKLVSIIVVVVVHSEC